MSQTNVNTEIVPTGKLRMGLNGSNATLVAHAADGSVSGIAADLGKFIAQRLGVSFEPVVYAGAATYTASFGKGEWDIIVTGRNPLAATLVDFMPDVILIDYVYIAAPGCEFADLGQVDRVGIKIGVPRNASADAFLSRSLKSAELVRVAGDADTAIEMLRDGKIDLYATGVDSVQKIADRLPGSSIIGAFETVAFAISTAKGRSPAAQSKLTQLVNEAKAAGIVQKAIKKSGQKGVRAAPD
ncbi:MAG: transporter substrate-binding domain-containing protein [Burkholderiales bacterium]